MTDESNLTTNILTPQDSIIVLDSMIPAINPEVTIREEMEEEGKYMLFNAENELILVINAAGKFILENCDGQKTITQLVDTIGQNYIVKDDMCLTEVVKGFIGTLLKAKLVKIKDEECR